MKKNQNGFSAVEGLLILVIVGLLGGVGWYVWQNKQDDSSKTNISSSAKDEREDKAQEEVYKVPEGYTLYENKELGFKFVYPKVYGNLTKQPDVNSIQILESAQPDQQYGAGINGIFTIYTYATADQTITGRKYGPQIKLQNGKWIVTEANESDVVGNKVGDEYKDFDKQVPASQTNNGLAVYTLKGGDEGTESDRLMFIANGKLHEIFLPSFSDGLYGNFDENPKANDKTNFNELLNNVRDSVRTL